MCGRPLAFREIVLRILGYAHFSGTARVSVSIDGSAEHLRTSGSIAIEL